MDQLQSPEIDYRYRSSHNLSSNQWPEIVDDYSLTDTGIVWCFSSYLRILPPYVKDSVRVEDIVCVHNSLMELTPNQAILAFIEVLKQWTLFGAQVFSVSVNTCTIKLPSEILGIKKLTSCPTLRNKLTN